uniref:Uncharacterized protein n=1 Tax=Arundo donax TaxID=35708 RepID=A0A0A9E3Z6_ARUDO
MRATTPWYGGRPHILSLVAREGGATSFPGSSTEKL